MFSVRSSPFNSRARSLYGGWALTDGVAGSTAAQLAAHYATHPGQAAKDQKWASLARKYSTNRAERDNAALIKSVLTREQIQNWRENPTWKRLYSQAMKHMRSPYMKQPFSATRRQSIWDRFTAIPWGNMSAADRAWIQAATNAPYAGVPLLTDVEDAPNFNTGDTVLRLGYRRPAPAPEAIEWRLPNVMVGPAPQLAFMDPIEAAAAAADAAAGGEGMVDDRAGGQ